MKAQSLSCIGIVLLAMDACLLSDFGAAFVTPKTRFLELRYIHGKSTESLRSDGYRHFDLGNYPHMLHSTPINDDETGTQIDANNSDKNQLPIQRIGDVDEEFPLYNAVPVFTGSIVFLGSLFVMGYAIYAGLTGDDPLAGHPLNWIQLTVKHHDIISNILMSLLCLNK